MNKLTNKISKALSPYSAALLFLQLSMIGLIFLSTGMFAKSIPLIFIQLVGIVLGLWSAYYLIRLSKFNAFAEVRSNSSLITRGPYKLIRHPVYLAILLYLIPIVLDDIKFHTIWAFFVLIVVLMFKINLEESYLAEEFNEFAKYRKRTWKIIPFIY